MPEEIVEPFKEKRRFKRAAYREAVQYNTPDLPEPQGCMSCDISEGGLRLNTEDFIPLNSEIVLNIRLPSEKVIECLGRVQWIQRIPHGERYQAGVSIQQEGSFWNACLVPASPAGGR